MTTLICVQEKKILESNELTAKLKTCGLGHSAAIVSLQNKYKVQTECDAKHDPVIQTFTIMST